MTTMKKVELAGALLLVLVLVLSSSSAAAAASSCNAAQLAPCAPALASGAKPSAGCCSSLKAQQSCFCGYAKNPAYARYINSPNARKTVTSCGLSVPRC
ncbi:hypothetical protein U9M48_005847 [Paspalum notatum var. saurae]|uniref:Bifunctional inhibitor/plant lipid transfer protein/seed storage helical domain-containing protein n=1 Tax=Paspalum notatum var. saurae TaxID=547442 RepID=A0AAQ3PYF6_PASNO